MPVLEEVLKDAMALSDDDQEMLLAHLIVALREPEDDEEEAWRTELRRRWAEVEAGTATLTEVGEDLDEIFAD